MSACPELKGSRVRDPLLLRSENRNKERFVEHEINIGISDENLMELHVRVLSGSRKWESQLGSASWKCKLELSCAQFYPKACVLAAHTAFIHAIGRK